jgi:primase-polymerase (primpol)-like protein
VVESIDSYTEVSVSGKGLHILARGEILRTRRNGGDKHEGREIEMYGNTGYFAFTGRRLENTPAHVEDRDNAVAALYEREFSDEVRATRQPERETKTNRTRKKWDRSECDYAMCREYARATDCDADRIYDLMESNPISQRSKWAERDDNYRLGVITAAIKSLEKKY